MPAKKVSQAEKRFFANSLITGIIINIIYTDRAIVWPFLFWHND